MIEMKFFLTEFDTKSRKLYQVERISTALISPNTQKIYDFFLEPKNFHIEDGIILSNLNKFSVISDY
jgi:hypothetical protein